MTACWFSLLPSSRNMNIYSIFYFSTSVNFNKVSYGTLWDDAIFTNENAMAKSAEMFGVGFYKELGTCLCR